MKRHLFIAAIALAASAAQANVLDFGNGPSAPTICTNSSNGLGSTVGCVDYSFMHQNYGDAAGIVDVSYSAPRLTDFSLRWWDINYNDLYGVLWADGGDANSMARIELKPLNGQAVNLTHFDLGAYVQTTRNTTVNVYEIGGGTALYSYSGPVGAGLSHTGFDVNISSNKGLWLEFQDSAYNVGIDNVTYTLVPEPSSVALMLAGLALCGAATRRRVA